MNCTEIVVFRARPGVSRERMVELGRRLQAFARSQPGFLDRHLFEDPSTGTFVDVVTWSSEALAKAAAAAFPTADCAREIEEAMEAEGMTLLHTREIPLG